MILGKRHQPKRQFGEVDCRRVAVHAVEAPLGHLTAGEDDFVLVRWDLGQCIVGMPRLDQGITQLPAGFHEEGARPHGRIANLEVENLLRSRRTLPLVAKTVEDGRQRVANDRLRKLPWRVVRTRATTLFTRLQHHRADGHDFRCRLLVDHWIEGGEQRFQR